MTVEEIQNSSEIQQFFAHLWAHPTFKQVMECAQRMALPSKNQMPKMAAIIPGVHVDTIIAHGAFYDAGWSDLVEWLKSIPAGANKLPETPTAEEEFAHSPEVAEIDHQLQIARKATPPEPPATPKSKPRKR